MIKFSCPRVVLFPIFLGRFGPGPGSYESLILLAMLRAVQGLTALMVAELYFACGDWSRRFPLNHGLALEEAIFFRDPIGRPFACLVYRRLAAASIERLHLVRMVFPIPL